MIDIYKRVETHKPLLVKLLIVLAILVLTVATFVSYADSQKVKADQSAQARSAVFNHTETLNDIKQAVTNIENNQKTNSTAIIDYINCLINSNVTTPAQVQAAEATCKAAVPQVK